MARRSVGTKSKTATKRTHHRRRRISGVSQDGSQMIGVVVGAIGSRVINNVVQKQFPGTSLVMVAGGVGALGYFAPKFIKTPIAKSVGLGMIAMAGTQLVVSTGIISGIGSTDRMRYRISGGNLTNLKAINGGVSTIHTMSGHRRVAGIDAPAPAEAVYHGDKNPPRFTDVMRKQLKLPMAS